MQFDKKQRFSIRKLSLGVCSVLVGIALFGAGHALAEETSSVASQATSSVLAKEEARTEAVAEETKVSEAPVEAVQGLATETEKQALASEAPVAESKEVTAGKEKEVKEEAPASRETKVVEDLPSQEDKKLKPKEIKFDTWQELLDWKPGAREDDEINRASVPLAERYQGHQINQQANPEAKVQALSNMNSKAKDHASIGGEEFKAYAFDYWQYLHSMVYWDGLVPTPDVIDAAHRNGVPIYGTLFFNWSSSAKDQERFAEALKEDSEGSKTFPIARKLVELAKYYGYDGYFINQETTGSQVEPLGPKMRDFLLYTKEYARSLNYPVKYSWYDAMTYEYGRYHENALGEYNYQFMQPKDGENPVDTFFANFNWGKAETDYSISTAKWIKRDPYDVLAGIELQKGGSYKTNVDWDAILDENGKLRLSLGLYAPDTITGLGKTGEGYHTHENYFWTGFQGDPSKGKPADQSWYGMSNLVVDKTAITKPDFNTSFNTGHGKRWFVDGKVSKDGEWNYRSVSGFLPTWRWWIRHAEGSAPLKGRYDFDEAYNGGNSLAFEGDLAANSNQNVMLYSTKIPVSDKTKLTLTHKGGQGTSTWVALATKPDYSEYEWKELSPSKDWKTETFDLSSLAGKTIYGVKMYFDHDKDVKDYKFNLGQLSIYSNQEKPAAPKDVVVKAKRLQNAQEAEALLQFKGSADADYYEIYEKDGDQWRLVTGTSSTSAYLAKVSRSASAKGSKQELKVVAVGKNGLRSEAGTVDFDWGMQVSDTSLPKPLAENVVLGAKVIGTTFSDADGSEGVEGMLNGTITSLSDKWSSAQLSGTVDIRLTQPRTVTRWVMEHAGAGGESVDDGKMNTRDFDLYYKDEAGEWKLAKAVRGNKDHVSDIVLDKPIRAQDWRLDVITADNGTPWRAIRIYNWKMYESLDTETVNVPMKDAAARVLGNGHVQVGFKDVPAKTTVSLYDSSDATKPIATMTADKDGNLIFKPLAFAKLPSLLYYRSQVAGKDISNVLAIEVPKEDKEISKVELETAPERKVYRQGDAQSLKGGTIRVSFKDGQPDQLVQLSNSGVEVTGYDPSKLGEQHLQLSYLGQKLDQVLTVFVVSHSEAGEKTPVGLEVIEKPKTDYIVGESLETTGGRFRLVFDDETTEEHTFDEAGVQVSGYDSHKEGRQTISVNYRGVTTTYDVFVSPKPALNDEYLKQKLAETASVQNKVDFSFATPEVKEALLKEIASAEQILKDHDTSTQDQVDESLAKLTQAFKALDGRKNFADKTAELDTLSKEAQALLEQKPNHPSGDALLSLLSKNKDLLASAEVTLASLETAKVSLQALIAQLQEDKPAVFVDESTGVEVQFSNKESTPIKGLKVAVVEPNASEKEALGGRLGKIYDVTGVDKDGHNVATQHTSLVKIPVEVGKEVEQVLSFVDNQPGQPLDFERVGDTIVFTASHLAHYAVIYKAEKSNLPGQDKPAETPKPSQPQGPETNQPAGENKPATEGQKPELGQTKPSDEVEKPELGQSKPSAEAEKSERGQKVQEPLAHSKESGLATASPEQAEAPKAPQLPKTGTSTSLLATVSGLLALVASWLLFTRKKEDQ